MDVAGNSRLNVVLGGRVDDKFVNLITKNLRCRGARGGKERSDERKRRR